MQTLALAPNIALTNSTRRLNLLRLLKCGYVAEPFAKIFPARL